MENLCPQCGAPAQPGTKCQYCGAVVPAAPVQQQAAPVQQQVVYVQQNDPRMNWPVKNKVVAGILALLLGGIGVHKFYLGKIGIGIVFILFCWTGIPAIIAFVEGIIILCSNNENFERKYGVRCDS